MTTASSKIVWQVSLVYVSSHRNLHDAESDWPNPKGGIRSNPKNEASTSTLSRPLLRSNRHRHRHQCIQSLGTLFLKESLKSKGPLIVPPSHALGPVYAFHFFFDA